MLSRPQTATTSKIRLVSNGRFHVPSLELEKLCPSPPQPNEYDMAAVVLTGPFFVVIVWLPLSLKWRYVSGGSEEGWGIRRHHYSHPNMMQQCISRHRHGHTLIGNTRLDVDRFEDRWPQ